LLNDHPKQYRVWNVFETVAALPNGIEIQFTRNIVFNPPAVRVAIVLTERAGTKDINDAVPQALAWNKALMLLQGPDPGRNERARVLNELDIAHLKGVSYSRLAEELNQEVADAVLGWASYARETKLKFDGMQYHSLLDLAKRVNRMRHWELRSWKAIGGGEDDDGAEASEIAAQILSGFASGETQNQLRQQRNAREAFRRDQELIEAWEADCFRIVLVFFKRDEAELLLFDAVENLDAGRKRFRPGCPFDGQKIRSVLEAWCESNEGRGSRERRARLARDLQFVKGPNEPKLPS
jgi:hypothetical protein